MFFKKKQNEEVKIRDPINPKIMIELLPDGKIFPSVIWEPHGSFNAQLFVKVLDLINTGKLYDTFRKAILTFGEKSGDMELANKIVTHMTEPNSLVDETPIISANMVSKYHFSQNKLTLNQGDVS